MSIVFSPAPFANDGSFLEQFLKRQASNNSGTKSPAHTSGSTFGSQPTAAPKQSASKSGPLIESTEQQHNFPVAAGAMEGASSGAKSLGIKGPGVNQDVLERWQQSQNRIAHRSGGVAPTGGTVAQVETRDARDQYLLQLRVAEQAQLSDPRLAQPSLVK